MPDSRQSAHNQLFGKEKPDGFAPPFAVSNLLVNHPEQLTAYELQNIFVSDNYRLAFNVYHQELADFMSWFNPSTNVGTFSGNGAEVAFKTYLWKQLEIGINGAWSKTEFKLGDDVEAFKANTALPANDKDEMVTVPAITAASNVTWEFTPNYFINLNTRYFTKQVTSFNELAPTENNPNAVIKTWGYTNNMLYMDLVFTAEDIMGIGLDASLAVYNITENQEAIAAQWRTYRAKPRGRNIKSTLAMLSNLKEVLSI